jgi:hypothetical protein
MLLPTQEVPCPNGELHAQGGGPIMKTAQADLKRPALFRLLADDLLAAFLRIPLDVKTENRSCKSRFSR